MFTYRVKLLTARSIGDFLLPSGGVPVPRYDDDVVAEDIWRPVRREEAAAQQVRAPSCLL